MSIDMLIRHIVYISQGIFTTEKGGKAPETSETLHRYSIHLWVFSFLQGEAAVAESSDYKSAELF